MKNLLALPLIGLASLATAQDAPPGSEVWLSRISGDGLDRPRNISAHPGYDNQPSFRPDGGAILYTRIDDGQADIHAYDLETGQTRHLTRTAESEYSPTPRPGHEGFSVVQVEADGKQRLWHFDAEGQSPRLLFPDIEPVGYFDWRDSDRAVMFVLGEPFTLQEAGIGSPAVVRDEDIGRGIRRLPDGRVAYVDKSEEPWTIRALAADGDSEVLASVPGTSEDFAVGPDGSLWMAVDSRIYCRSPEADAWILAADLAPLNITGITRLAVHPAGTHLAFVAAEG